MSNMQNCHFGVFTLMGADILDEIHYAGVEAIKHLPREGKEYLAHHIRNSLQAIIFHNKAGEQDKISEVVSHMVRDLERVGL